MAADYSIRPVSLNVDREPATFGRLALFVVAAIGMAAGVMLGLGIGAAIDEPLPAESVLAGELDKTKAESAEWKAIAERLPGVQGELDRERAKAVELAKRVEQLREIEHQALADRDAAVAKQTELADKLITQESMPGKSMLRWEHDRRLAAEQEVKNLRRRLADGH